MYQKWNHVDFNGHAWCVYIYCIHSYSNHNQLARDQNKTFIWFGSGSTLISMDMHALCMYTCMHHIYICNIHSHSYVCMYRLVCTIYIHIYFLCLCMQANKDLSADCVCTAQRHKNLEDILSVKTSVWVFLRWMWRPSSCMEIRSNPNFNPRI